MTAVMYMYLYRSLIQVFCIYIKESIIKPIIRTDGDGAMVRDLRMGHNGAIYS